MFKSRKISIAVVSLLLLVTVGYVSCTQMYPSGTWRYKITVNVETPEGLKSGSSVREVTFKSGPKILPDVSGSSWKVTGEAVVVDLGKGKYLFALMDVDGSYQIVHDVFPYEASSRHNYIKYYQGLTGQRKALTPSQYPLLVTFANIKDPKTVKKVGSNELSKVLGQGIVLKDITLEMTDESVWHEISKYLPWLDQIESQKVRLNGSSSVATFSNEILDNLGAASFKIGK